MYQVQELMRRTTFREPLGKCTTLPLLIELKFPFAWICVIPLCQSCLLACARNRTPKVKRSTAYPENEGAFSCN
jgi:hypothetical protein